MVKVLYVEDEPAQRELVNQLLLLIGIDIQLAENGIQGLEKARTWMPDVILMDLRMPGMNGFETIERLKEIPETADIPIIILSAWTSARLNERADALGVYRCVNKPFDLNELVEAIESVPSVNRGDVALLP